MGDQLATLTQAVKQARVLLLADGHAATSQRPSDLADRLRSGATDAIVTAASEAMGGMGSMNDQVLSDALANFEYQAMVRNIENLARAAAAQLGIRLFR